MLGTIAPKHMLQSTICISKTMVSVSFHNNCVSPYYKERSYWDLWNYTNPKLIPINFLIVKTASNFYSCCREIRIYKMVNLNKAYLELRKTS